jgi:formylglycine-generating enzyme
MRFLVSFYLVCVSVTAHTDAIAQKGMVLVETGQFRPFTSNSAKTKESKAPPLVTVSSFLIDEALVTNSEFLNFVEKNPEWQKSQVKPIFADAHYLQNWSADLKFEKRFSKSPVTFVSWFAASAYCEFQGKTLPTTDQWEFALFDNGREQEKLQRKILDWYAKPSANDSPIVLSNQKNQLGIRDLGYTAWEWTEDFNSFLVSSDSREDSGKNSGMFCGNGSQMGDPANYAAFMRYSLRSSLRANYTTASLGFRCAKEKR